jgi:hypothetical protein
MNKIEINEVSGGFLPALIAIITIITLPKIIHENHEVCNEWGHNLGEWAWEHNHPYDPNQ